MMIKSMLLNLGLFVLRTTEDGGAGGGIDTSWLKNGDSGAVQPFINVVQNMTYGIWQLFLTIGIAAALISLAVGAIILFGPGKSKDDGKSRIIITILGIIFLAAVADIVAALVKIGSKAGEALENESGFNSIERDVLIDEQTETALAYADRLCGGGLLG